MRGSYYAVRGVITFLRIMIMRFCCRYEELIGDLAAIASVVDSGISHDDMKNIIFECSDAGVVLIGVNPLVIYKRRIPEGVYSLELDDGDSRQDSKVYMQIKSKELMSYLDTYKSLKRTVAKDVSFEFTSRGQVRCTVVEMRIPDGVSVSDARQMLGDPNMEYISSHWVFNNIVAKRSLLSSINVVLPEGCELEVVDRTEILFHTRNMLPIMQTDMSLFGQMIFDGGYAVAFSAAYNVFMRNQVGVGNIFSGIKLSYHVLKFLDRVICQEDEIGVARTEKQLYFRTGCSEAFVIYDTKLAEYRAYLDMFRRDHGVLVDRQYLKDVLRRFSLRSDSIVCKIDGISGVVTLSNTSFEQELPVLSMKSMKEYGVISFKIMPDVFAKAIIGDDNEFSNELFIYYTRLDSGVTSIVFTDASDAWFSIIRVKVS